MLSFIATLYVQVSRSSVAPQLAFNRQAVRPARYIRIEINYFASSDGDFIHLTGRCGARDGSALCLSESTRRPSARLVLYTGAETHWRFFLIFSLRELVLRVRSATAAH